MQEEINTKVVALAVRTGKFGAQELQAVMRKYLQEHERRNIQRKNQKQAVKQARKVARVQAKQKQSTQGKQTVRSLMDQNQNLANIEVTEKNIKSFQRIANKYDIDFALKKDKTLDPPRYMVFFKAKDTEVMKAAFRDFTTIEQKKLQKPSVQKKLQKAEQKAREKAKVQQQKEAQKQLKQRQKQLNRARDKGRER